MRKGVTLDDNGDLLISNRAMIIGQTDYQNISLLIQFNQGDVKEYPTLGTSLEKDIKSTNKDAQISRKIQMQLQADGYSADIHINNGKIQIVI